MNEPECCEKAFYIFMKGFFVGFLFRKTIPENLFRNSKKWHNLSIGSLYTPFLICYTERVVT